MASKTYTSGTVIDSASLNDFNDVVYDILGNGTVAPATEAIARTNLGSTAVGDAVFIAASEAAGRTALGLGTMSTQAASAVAITGGSVTGITDLAVADGGTGSSTASGARTNLGATSTGSSLFTAATATAAKTVVDASAPAFSAYQSTLQTLPNATLTKLQLQTEEYDTAGAFDNATNYRFQPLVAGYYQISGGFQVATTVTVLSLLLYKNGAVIKQLAGVLTNAGAAYGSAIVYLNGSTDYVELFATQGAAAQNTVASDSSTYFQAFLARAT